LVTVEDFPEEFRTSVAGKEVPIALSPEETERHLDDSQVPGGIEPLRTARRRIERTMIIRALQITQGKRAAAAELLEIKPRTLRQKMSDYNIKFRRARPVDLMARDA
jgi:DNA-binding NtrC family response regulator